MADLTVQDIARTGLAPSYVAAASGGDSFNNDDGERTFLQVKNGGAGSINVTIATQKSSVQLSGFGAIALSDAVVAVPNGGERLIGPFPGVRFTNSAGKVSVAYSGVTTVTVAAIRVPREIS